MPASEPPASAPPIEAAARQADAGPAPTRVLRQFRLVFNAVKTHFREVERQAGIGGAQLWALSVVRDQPRIGIGALAAALDIHQATASNLVKSLASSGLLAVARGAADRRAVQLVLLPAGEAVLHKAPGPFTGVLPEALARLDPHTLERLEQDLATLIEALDTDEHAARIPLAQL